LAPGDRLLLYTDGITEAARLDGEEFGEQRVINAATCVKQRSSTALKHEVLTQVKKFCDSQLHDDATLIVVSVAETEARASAAC
jgi:sigma-B regulation protein RsbU (phosphoserine phosphatase)